MSFKYYSSLLTVLICFGLPPRAFGQYIRKESVGGKTFAIIYSEELPKTARWEPGIKMMRNGATIRHQVSKGNGNNLSVNDKIPLRFIVAPTDIGPVSWIAATGVTDGDNNLNTDFTTQSNTGCRNYGTTTEGANRKWRVPTQRELQLMWLFREVIPQVYTGAPMEDTTQSKRYWAATEQDATNAWYFDFKKNYPECSWQLKTSTGYVRCVSDY